MSAAVILTFPHDSGSEVDRGDVRHVGRSVQMSADKLTTVRLDIRHSLLLLDIAVFHLRATATAHARELFKQELATIEELLDAARAIARQI